MSKLGIDLLLVTSLDKLRFLFLLGTVGGEVLVTVVLSGLSLGLGRTLSLVVSLLLQESRDPALSRPDFPPLGTGLVGVLSPSR